MTIRTTRRFRLLSAVSMLALACGVLTMSSAPAGAAVNRPAAASARPLTCTPTDLPIRFSSSTTWETRVLTKSADGCQSVWATSGQTFNYEVVTPNNMIFGTCGAGFCQIWNPAGNNVPFVVADMSFTPTSVNFYY